MLQGPAHPPPQCCRGPAHPGHGLAQLPEAARNPSDLLWSPSCTSSKQFQTPLKSPGSMASAPAVAALRRLLFGELRPSPEAQAPAGVTAGAQGGLASRRESRSIHMRMWTVSRTSAALTSAPDLGGVHWPRQSSPSWTVFRLGSPCSRGVLPPGSHPTQGPHTPQEIMCPHQQVTPGWSF